MSPDILLFISDQHAPQYQAGGQMPVDTPNLAALRGQGTAFDAAYTPCPLCVPARMAMLSGLAPHHTGIFTNNDTLPQTTPTFLHAMAAAGYETVLVGRMHFIGPDQRHVGVRERKQRQDAEDKEEHRRRHGPEARRPGASDKGGALLWATNLALGVPRLHLR